jgi:flagellar hook-basal body complex protein FliE
VVLPSGDGTEEPSQTCTVITTLLAAPADAIRDTYLTRWSASETTFGEDKSVITGAGNRTSGSVLRSGSPRLVIQEAWAWLTATQLVRASEAAALRTEAAAARALRRRSQQEVTADEESFTAALRHAIRSMTSTQVTASSSLHALAAAADAAARAALHTLNVPGRQRHSPRAQKARPKFPHASATKMTVTGKPRVTVFAPGFS